MQSLAICSGVIGTLSDFPVVSPEPVTAQVMNTEVMGVLLVDRVSRRPALRMAGEDPVQHPETGEDIVVVEVAAVEATLPML